MTRTRFMFAVVLAISTPAEAGQRLVAVGGAVTEIVYALGAGNQLVATDTTSLYPAAAAGLPKVGYMRALTAEGLLTLAPDLVLAVQDAGPTSALRQLRQAGTQTVIIGADLSPDSIADRIRAIGAALGQPVTAEAMAQAFAADLAGTQAAAAALPHRPRTLFLLSATGGAILASGRATAADAVIKAAGGENAISDYDGYKPASAEAVVAADPAVILLTTQTLEAIGGIEKVRRLPGVAATRAAREDRILHLESGYLLGLGPRTAHAIRDLAQALTPTASLPPLPARAWTEAP